MLIVHGHTQSINVRKVLWLCAELELGVQRVERGTAMLPVSDAAFRALNPFGLVPVIDDDGFVVSESNTILRYLARREGRGDLLPADARAAAMIERWIDWQATDFNDAWRYAFVARFRDVPGYDDPAMIARSRAAFDAKVGIVEAQLAATGGFVAGAAFTLADIPIGLSIRRWLAFDDVPRDRCPHVVGYYQRLCARAAFLPFGGCDSPP
jgi:glutathione S-transferase